MYGYIYICRYIYIYIYVYLCLSICKYIYRYPISHVQYENTPIRNSPPPHPMLPSPGSSAGCPSMKHGVGWGGEEGNRLWVQFHSGYRIFDIYIYIFLFSYIYREREKERERERSLGQISLPSQRDLPKSQNRFVSYISYILHSTCCTVHIVHAVHTVQYRTMCTCSAYRTCNR